MDKLVISGEGFPLTQETLLFKENQFQEPMKALTATLGNNVIVSGMNYLTVGSSGGVGNTTISNGFVVIGNELLPFVGGSYSGSVGQFLIVVVEETTSAGYDSQSTGNFNANAPVWKKRWAQFGTPGIGESFVPFSSLTRLKNNLQLQNSSSVVKKGDAELRCNNNQPTLPTFVTGDFTGVEFIPNPAGVNENPKFKIKFSHITGDYVPLINADLSVFNLVLEVGYIELAPDYIIIEIRPNTYNTSFAFSGRFNIQLLKI